MLEQNNLLNDSHDRAMLATVPMRTDSYSPVSHSAIVSAIRDNAETNNLALISSRVYSNTSGSRVVGFMDIEDGSDFGSIHGLKMMIGWRNSYDKSMSLAFVAGATVMICENGMISGDLMAFKRKHTGLIVTELQEKIQIGFDKMREDFGTLNVEVDVMKNYSLTPRQKAELLGVMYFENNLVTPNQLSIVKKELNESKVFNEDNAWSLYNNVTESLKKSHPVDIIQDHIKLHSFMKGVIGMEEAEIVADAPITQE